MTTVDSIPDEPLPQPGHDDDHPPHLAHHFESSMQQFEAAKLGMWLFLATELLLFGGLFCAYAVFRSNHPDIFQYGSQFLDTKWGATNTLVLILSSMTMALAVTAAQRGQKTLLVVLLALTICGGLGFMGIKYVEYSHKFHDNLVWGVGFYEPPHHDDAEHEDTEAVAAAPEVEAHGDLQRGKELFWATCRSCHGVKGEGVPGQGKDQRGSEFIASQSDKELVAFIKVGRMSFDPANTTGIQMPPKGGNPLLKDQDLLDIVAYVRTFDPAPVAAEEGDDGSEVEPEEGAPVEAEPEAEFWIPKSSIPDAPPGPSGLSAAYLAGPDAEPVVTEPPDRFHDPDRPQNAHLFFGVYFLMTGLHGVHVIVGIIVISMLLVGALRGRFGPDYFTPVDLVGLYWHVVDLIWIFLFPLFYLI